jgi:hypothetical protein
VRQIAIVRHKRPHDDDRGRVVLNHGMHIGDGRIHFPKDGRPQGAIQRILPSDGYGSDPVDFQKSEKGQDSDNQPTIVELPPFHRELGRARTGMMVVVQLFPAE